MTSATGTSLGAANVGTVGTITITDNATLSGSFTVTATDGSAASSAATVTFTNNTTGTLTLNAAASGDSIIVNKSTSGATMTGGAGNDYIIGNTGADTIVGAQNDKVLDGGGGTDTLNVGANFTSTSDAQIVNIENVTLTAASTLNLSNQTEGFTITGSSGINSITAGSGNDTIVGAAERHAARRRRRHRHAQRRRQLHQHQRRADRQHREHHADGVRHHAQPEQSDGRLQHHRLVRRRHDHGRQRQRYHHGRRRRRHDDGRQRCGHGS